MRVIAVKTLRLFWEKEPATKEALLSWYEEAELAEWKNPAELKNMPRNASIITGKRIVFNIHGNSYRLIVDIEFRMQIIFIVWVGSHRDYDLIDAKTIAYDKANKN